MTQKMYDMQELTEGLRKSMREVGLNPDKYDPDFIIACLVTKLRDMNAALTGTGVRRFKK